MATNYKKLPYSNRVIIDVWIIGWFWIWPNQKKEKKEANWLQTDAFTFAFTVSEYEWSKIDKNSTIY